MNLPAPAKVSIAALAVAVMLGGCASGSRPPEHGPTPHPLRSSVLPAWQVERSSTGLWAEVETPRALRCLGAAGSRPVAQQGSTSYSPPDALAARRVSSEVVAFSSPAQAVRVGRALASQAGANCLLNPLVSYLRPAARSTGLSLAPSAQVTAMSVAPTSTTVSFGYRAAVGAVPVATNEHLVAIYVDLAGFVRGRYLVQIVTVSVGQLFPEPAERHLLDLLASRKP